MTTSHQLHISAQTMRRFILGQQGLYPGRRWRGREGVRAALAECGSVQIDPVQVIARAHDVILASRVLDYHPDDLYTLAYRDRAAFDYGWILYMFPMTALPYLRLVMARVADDEHVRAFLAEHAETCTVVRDQLRGRGPLGHRDLDGKAVSHYRARKDTGLALQRLWLTGELMTHSRRGFDRLYYFADHIAPPDLLEPAAAAQSDFFTRQVFLEMGLVTGSEWAIRYRNLTGLTISAAGAARQIADYVARGLITPLTVAGRKGTCYVLTASVPLIDTLEAGGIPAGWEALETTTAEEVTLLAPLEMTTARGRAKPVFNFDYKWEIYTPEEKRQYGYYVLPILYGDRLVGRLDPHLDRAAGCLSIDGLWLEDLALAAEAAFIEALGRGLARFVRFHGAQSIQLDGVKPAALKRSLMKLVKSAL